MIVHSSSLLQRLHVTKTSRSRLLVPLGLCIQAQHRVRQRRCVRRHVRRCVRLGALHRIQDLQHLALDEVDKHEINGRLARHVWRVGADVVRRSIIAHWDVQRVVASAGAALIASRERVDGSELTTPRNVNAGKRRTSLVTYPSVRSAVSVVSGV